MKLEKNEKMSIYSGMASTISVTAVSAYIPLFAIGVLGASNQQVGLITALPSIIGMIALIPGAIWLNRSASKKNFTVISTLAARFLFMLIMFVPFLAPGYAAWALLALIGLLNFPGTLSLLSWQSMIGDLVPEERRGHFFSLRNRLNAVMALLITFATGFFLTYYNQKSAFPYQVLFIVGFLFALIEVYYLMKHKEPPKTMDVKAAKTAERGFSLAIFRYKPYVAFIICGLLFNFGAQMAWSLFSIFHIREANATALWLSLFTVTNQLAQIISMKWWAGAAEKWGNTMVLFVAAAGMATAPILTVMSTNLLYLTGINLWIGLFVSGTNLLLFNQLLKASPEKDRTTYIANYNFLLAIVGFIAPQLGVFLLNQVGMNAAMGIISIVRFMAGLSFLVVALRIDRGLSIKPAVRSS
ncbi:MFS transporter [Bacillus lacus]|uniref:MFS transporter n=1 Tax=Metabacillus lacus TaxID=1983721 RepID=A0A7X2IXJ8_9BACI|nr:MFS transporter [Metabacillus lacus]MRX71519.1 MFS transporter [Metabacillus lacus]